MKPDLAPPGFLRAGKSLGVVKRFDCRGGWVSFKVSASIRAGKQTGRLICSAINLHFGGCFKRISPLISQSIASLQGYKGFTFGGG